jgi:hypothetical protein
MAGSLSGGEPRLRGLADDADAGFPRSLVTTVLITGL